MSSVLETPPKRTRRTSAETEALQAKTYGRAAGGRPNANYVAIMQGFMAKGLSADEIEPRVNVFTYNAWRAKGRQVRRGEHGVAVVTWITIKHREPDADGTYGASKRQKRATVFHESQTDLIQ